MNKCLIISNNNNVTEAITYVLPDVDIEFEVYPYNDLSEITKKFSNLILVNCTLSEKEINKFLEKDANIIVIDSNITIIDTNHRINYIKTDLVNDNKIYSDGEKDFLFKMNIYSILNKQVLYLLSEESEYLNCSIIDIAKCKPKFDNGIFEFQSISESYAWLTDKLNGETFKEISYMIDRIYNDSDKEIRYLVNKTKKLKEGKIIKELFVCDRENANILKQNVFFKLLINNIGQGEVYVVSKDKLKDFLQDEYNDILYGIIIYEDSVYRDYLDNEYSLGYIDCKKETIDKYNSLFDSIVEKVATKIESVGDLDEIFQ